MDWSNSRSDGRREPVTTEEDDGASDSTEDFAPSGSPSLAVVEAVCRVVGESPTAIDPLAEVIDPEALDALFRPTGQEPARSDGTVTFAFCGCEVVVCGTGEITVVPLEGE
jgi:hypothetical protein